MRSSRHGKHDHCLGRWSRSGHSRIGSSLGRALFLRRCETRVRSDHPLRAIRSIVNDTLDALSGKFEALYAAGGGRPSIPPEMLLRAMLLQAFYTIRSERQLMERLEFNLLFRWFVGLSADEPAWDHSTFSKNREVVSPDVV